MLSVLYNQVFKSLKSLRILGGFVKKNNCSNKDVSKDFFIGEDLA